MLTPLRNVVDRLKRERATRRFSHDGMLQHSNIDIVPILARRRRNNIPYDPSLYALKQWQGSGRIDGRHVADTNYAFALCAGTNMRALAVAGFVPYPEEGIIVGGQYSSLPLHPVSNEGDRRLLPEEKALLDPFDIGPLLIDVMVTWAAANGFVQARSRTAHEVHRRLKQRYDTMHDIVDGASERLHKRYNESPKKVGFNEPDDEHPYFWLPLTQEHAGRARLQAS